MIVNGIPFYRRINFQPWDANGGHLSTVLKPEVLAGTLRLARFLAKQCHFLVTPDDTLYIGYLQKTLILMFL